MSFGFGCSSVFLFRPEKMKMDVPLISNDVPLSIENSTIVE